MDSFIELTSGATLLWRMSVDADVERRERNEKLSLRIVGACFLGLATYIAYEAISNLASKTAPAHSIPGIVLACVSLVVMPILSRAKKKVGNALASAAMNADARRLSSVSISRRSCSSASSSMRLLDGGGQMLRLLWS